MFKYQIVKALIDMQTKDLLDNSSANLKKASFQTSQDVKDYYLKADHEPIIAFSSQMKQDRNALQDLLYEKLYRHFRVERMTEKAKRVINQIFEVYDSNPNQLPYDIWDRAESSNEKTKYEAICNYIAGMTDRFALDEHKKLFEPYQKV